MAEWRFQSEPEKDNLKDQPCSLTGNVVDPPVGLTLEYILKDHTSGVNSVAWSPDGKRLASSSHDNTIHLWDSTPRTLRGYTGRFRQVAWSPNGEWLVSGSNDGSVWVWNATEEELPHPLKGRHKSGVNSVAWSPNGKCLASGSHDKTIWLSDPMSGERLHLLEGHASGINSVAWSPNGKCLASGSHDKTIGLWDPMDGALLGTLDGHTSGVSSVAWSPDGKKLASGSYDNTIHVWDLMSGALLYTLEGHTSGVNSVAWSPDGQLLASASSKNIAYRYNTGRASDVDIYIWNTDTWEPVAKLTDLKGYVHFDWHPLLPLLATVGQEEGDIAVWHLDLKRLLGVDTSSGIVHYRNAKVVLVGDSGVGKSGLGFVLSEQPFTVTESTHGRHIWNFDRQEVSLDERRRETRETLLWDLAGQPGYRLIHQLHLNEVAVALVVFDAHSETNPFAGVRHWDKALRLAQSIRGSTALPLKKFLVAARIDRGGPGVSSERTQAVIEEFGFDGYFATSAKEGWQVGELRAAICQAIDWESLPRVTSTVFFRQIKQFLLGEKQRAKRLISSTYDLYSTFLHSKDAPAETPELPAQFETCMRSVEWVGLIKRLSFGKLVLLQPELLDAYASALINAVKDEPDGLGCISEEQARRGDFRMPADERMQDREQEKLLLIAMIEDLLRRELALREEGMLVFPSQSTKENPHLYDHEGKAIVFMFEGPILNIYATLAVRLARSGLFEKQDLWKNAVTYTTQWGGGTYGMFLRNIDEGRGDLTLFFDRVASSEMRKAFIDYVHRYLWRRALSASLSVRRVPECEVCGTAFNENQIKRRKELKYDSINCPVCGTSLSLTAERPQPASSFDAKEMDRVADNQREREVAQLTVQGKIATRDFDVFLCYHSTDRLVVKQIGEQLKQRRILPWLDEWDLRPGLPWHEQLEEQIQQIRSAAVFVGKDGIGPWQHQELNAFLYEFVRRGCPVIPVLLPDAPCEPVLPIFLRGLTWVDFRRQDPNPLQWLLWGITGRRDIE